MNMFKRCIIALLTIILALPVLPANTIASAASKPSLSMSTMNLIGTGATSPIIKLNNVDMSKVKRLTWYTQNEKVAIAESASKDNLSAKVTAVGKGKTNVRVKITYKNGDVERPSCSVTVQIPATGVEISNAKDNDNNTHVIILGESFDFNRALTPSNANDKTYWFLEPVKGVDIATVDTKGIVKALKPGFVRLTAKAALTKAEASNSKITDSVMIEIVEKSAQVVDVALVNNTTLKVKFNIPMNSSTLLTKDNKIQDSIKITAKTDEKGVNAKPVGELTGTLSTDGKELTITSAYGFNGLYGILMTNLIKSTDGLSLINYNENLELYDTVRPFYDGFTTDETGLKVIIKFSEPVNISELKIEDVKPAVSNDTILPLTLNILKDKANYKLSKDRKSLEIDLTSISTYDYNKLFTVTVSGIKDDAGLYTQPYIYPIHFKADTSPKPQARLISLTRTGYNTLTAIFDRAIQYAGNVQLSNGEFIAGVVDLTDNKKVNYTLSQFGALLTGIQEVSIGYWNGYNVDPRDTSASLLTKRPVNFVAESSIPVITKNELTVDQTTGDYLLTLTYNKNIITATGAGSFSTRIVTLNNDIYSDRALGYTAMYKDNTVTLILRKDQFIENGLYTITVPAGFARDSYMNQSTLTTVSFRKDAAVSSELPGPLAVEQAIDNANVVYVTFANKVDEATAQNVANYTIEGVTIISATLKANNAEGATVELTLLENSVTIATVYPVYIKNIMGYHNTYTAMKPYQTRIPLRKNKAPSIREIKYVSPNSIILTFDETITGTPSFSVMQGNQNLAYSSFLTDQTVTIMLTTNPPINTMLRIEANLDNDIRDIHGNRSVISTQYVVVK